MPWKRILRAFRGGLGLAILVFALAATAADAQSIDTKPVLELNELEQLPPDRQRTEQLGTLSVGPDVTIIDVTASSGGNYTSGGGTPCPPGYEGDCRGYSLGTNSCNIGSVPVDWCDDSSGCRTTTNSYQPVAATPSDHSVIGQNLYRLKDGRFEQIGASFLKHGFFSTNSGNSACAWNDNGTPNTSCVFPPNGGQQLGVGCTDFYGQGLNGSRPLGRRSDVNAGDADHPENPAGGETGDAYDQRMVVQESDLDPALNVGALYWGEAHYVVRDDARSGPTASPPAPPSQAGGTLNAWLGENGLNNASYIEVTIGGPGVEWDLNDTGPTVRERSAIYAWQAVDAEVEIVNVDRQTFFVGDPVDPPGSGVHPDHWVVERFEAARRVYEPAETGGRGSLPYRYEYAIHNMNSDTSADGFMIEFPGGASFANVGFTDIDHHSGEPYDTSDWSITIDEPNGTITWAAEDMGVNTNALRWGTTFSFYFESDLPPDTMNHTLDLFKIDEPIDVPFLGGSNLIFADGFESGSTAQWDSTIP